MNGQTATTVFVPLPGGGQAVYNASGLLFYHSDHLGSFRFASNYNRTMSFDLAHAPFGEVYATSGSTDPSFTGQRQDTVAGLYDFPAREYSYQGRWPSPDPAGLAAVDPSNPQSWNRYAYVMNNPLALTDPDGLDPCQGANNFAFSQAANGTGIFTQDDCIANGGTWGDSFLNGPGGGGSIGNGPPGPDTTPGCIPVPNPDPFGSGQPILNCNTDGSSGPGSIASSSLKPPGIVMKKEVDALLSPIVGDAGTMAGPVGPSAIATGAEIALDKFADRRPLVNSVRTILRAEGWKVSSNAVARVAKFFGRAALATHVGFAAADGVEAYDACMAD